MVPYQEFNVMKLGIHGWHTFKCYKRNKLFLGRSDEIQGNLNYNSIPMNAWMKDFELPQVHAAQFSNFISISIVYAQFGQLFWTWFFTMCINAMFIHNIWSIIWTNVSFIPYFRLFVFGILVTLVVWFSFSFFHLAHLALQNVNKDYVIFS